MFQKILNNNTLAMSLLRKAKEIRVLGKSLRSVVTVQCLKQRRCHIFFIHTPSSTVLWDISIFCRALCAASSFPGPLDLLCQEDIWGHYIQLWTDERTESADHRSDTRLKKDDNINLSICVLSVTRKNSEPIMLIIG